MKLRNNIAVLMAGLLTVSGCVFVSCDKDDLSTEQFKGGVSLASAQLEVTRGGYMNFKGSGLDAITEIIFTGDARSPKIVVEDAKTIKCEVPMGAMPGVVELVYNGGSLKTGEVSFTEPIEFESISAKSMKYGDKVTIKGQYLNYMEFVRFATGEAVALTPSDRPAFEISFTVPKDASTGELVMGYYLDDAKTEANEFPCGDVTVAAPKSNLAAATKKDLMPGASVVIEGENLNLVQALSLPGDSVLTNFTFADGKITFSVYKTMPAGMVKLVAFSGLEYDAVTVEPKAPKAAAALTGKNGTVVAEVECSDIALVNAVKFLDVNKEEVDAKFTVADGKLNITIPAEAVSGKFILEAASLARSEAEFTTVKPVVASASMSPLLPGKSVTFTGTDMDLVKTVIMPSEEKVDVEVAEGQTAECAFVVPATAKGNGKIIAVMTNGEELKEFFETSITAAEFCFIPKLEKEYKPAAIASFRVKNPSALESVMINGQPAQHMFNGSVLYVYIPASSAGDVATIKLLSGAKGECEVTVNVMAVPLIEEFVFEGMLEVKGWGGADLPTNFPVPLPEGSKIRIRVAPEPPTELQFMDGYWGQGPNWAIKNDANKNVIYISADDLKKGDYYEIPVPKWVIDDEGTPYEWDGKVSFNADGVVVTGISYVYPDLAEVVEVDIMEKSGTHGDAIAWTFPVTLSWSDNAGKFAIKKDSPENLADLVKLGKTMRFYTEGKGQIQINNPSWGQIEIIQVDEPGQVIEIKLTQPYIDAFENGDGWSSAWLICQGDELVITRVTIEE